MKAVDYLETDVQLDLVGKPVVDFIAHELYGKLMAPRGLNDLLKLLNSYSHLAQTCKFDLIWRGQSNINWPLDSSICRKAKEIDHLGTLSTGLDVEKRVSSLEKQIIREARNRGFHFSGTRSIGEIELLALLQHQGAQTRLIDFTRNFFVALWFASHNFSFQDDKLFSVVFGLAFDNKKARKLTHDDSILQVQQIFNSYPDKDMFVYHPRYQPGRMQVQQSALVFSKVTTESNRLSINTKFHEGEWAKVKKDEKHGVFAFAISGDLRTELLHSQFFKNILGFTHLDLFPEMDGFAKNFSYNWSSSWAPNDYSIDVPEY